MRILFAAAIAAVAIPALPAAAQTPRQEYRQTLQEVNRRCEWNTRHARTAREANRARLRCERERREARQELRSDRRDVRQTNNREWQRDWRRYRSYDYNRLPPGESQYYADDYYRDGRYYQERRLTRNDRIYRGRDGRYYCRRSDGTTGLIVGGVAGGLFGNAIAGGRNATLGTLLGAAIGATVGASVDRNEVRCR